MIILISLQLSRGGWEGRHIEDFAFIGDIGACAYCQDASDKDDDMAMMVMMKVRCDIDPVKNERILSQYLCSLHLQNDMKRKQSNEKERNIISDNKPLTFSCLL